MDPLIFGAAALGGLAYAVSGYWKKHKEEDLDIKKMLPAVIYGLVIGSAAAILSGDLSSVQAAFTAGLTGSVLLEKVIGGLK